MGFYLELWFVHITLHHEWDKALMRLNTVNKVLGMIRNSSKMDCLLQI